MRKFSLCLAALFVLAVAAQAAPKAEVFGGYQYTRQEIGSLNMNGWNASLTGNFDSNLGITADFSQTYNSGLHYSTYTFGPEAHAYLPIIKPFAHALIGGARLSGGGGGINGVAMYFGGGVDAGHGPLAWRVAQFDWLFDRFQGVGFRKNVRISTGLVVRF